ncbi:hypothetical protein K505DRAFT_22281 [Melanomma pulvis-pyrius CBS 109.77]|uniref:Secreted protein n=1 Tax=Melanomma pulvis-pyrius CBS 109.77 TaxID=1314802 RepID=A0A6A6XFB4_9PLEO|nr:hypothetical protein K505DRAFT_22281 [Melanomma pulvis-pyrius CBS 109.77]
MISASRTFVVTFMIIIKANATQLYSVLLVRRCFAHPDVHYKLLIQDTGLCCTTVQRYVFHPTNCNIQKTLTKGRPPVATNVQCGGIPHVVNHLKS